MSIQGIGLILMMTDNAMQVFFKWIRMLGGGFEVIFIEWGFMVLASKEG